MYALILYENRACVLYFVKKQGMYVKVKNCCNKIWQETCENEEILKDWIMGSNNIATGICSFKNCTKPAEYGGCVEIVFVDNNDLLNLRSSKEDIYYIIPLCKDCLKRFGEEYEVKEGTYPVLFDRVFCKTLRKDCIENE